MAMDSAIMILGGLAVIPSASANYHRRRRSSGGAGPSGITGDPLKGLE